MSEEVTGDREREVEMIDGVLRPLLEADDASIELLEVDASRVHVRVGGNAAYGVGCSDVGGQVVEPASHEVAPKHEVTYELEVPTAKKRGSTEKKESPAKKSAAEKTSSDSEGDEETPDTKAPPKKKKSKARK